MLAVIGSHPDKAAIVQSFEKPIAPQGEQTLSADVGSTDKKSYFLSTATVSLNVFNTLFTMSLHEVIVTTSITALGIFGNMCYTVAVK